ncbi:MAG: hypothetical protein GEU95_01585 [Rhizobiales bacterium]|nr:hypothetical protein [Hyphomicrobiales bacterium]
MYFTRLLTSTAAFAVAATIANAADMPMKAPPFAPPVVHQASGYIEVYGGWGSTRFSDNIGFFNERFRGWALGGAGRGNYWLSPNISMQLDAQAEGTSYKVDFGGGGFTANQSSHSYLIGGHFNWRDSQRGLLGVFAAAGDQQGLFDFESRRHVIVGGEGQIYWNQFTLYVQGGYDTSVGTYFFEPQAWFVRGTGRYFFTPNTMLEGTVLYADGEIDFFFNPGDPQNFKIWLWEAKLEHRFAATPFALYIKYQGSEAKFDESLAFDQSKVTDHRVLAGLRLFMGQNTLLSNDRQGATLDIKEFRALLPPILN